MPNEQRLEALQPDYRFDENEFQPALFAVDLPPTGEGGSLTFEEVRLRETRAMRQFAAQLRAIVLADERQRASEGQSGVPAFYEIFLDLLDGGWPPRVAAYIAWASSPRIGRWPKTQEELAQMLGLTSDRQFTVWRKKNPVIDILVAKLGAAPLLQYRADVLAALAESARNPDYKNNPDRRLFLEITGDYTPIARLEAEMRRAEGNDQTTEREQRLIEKIIDPESGG